MEIAEEALRAPLAAMRGMQLARRVAQAMRYDATRLGPGPCALWKRWMRG